MSRYPNSVDRKWTQFWFVPSECQTNPLYFNRETGLHNHMLRSLISNSDFPIPRKLALFNVKSFPSNCFFFVFTRPKPPIRFPFESLLLVTQPWKKYRYLSWVKSEIDWECSQILFFCFTSKFKPVLFQKIRTAFFKKITIKKFTFVKEDLIEKPPISLLTPKKLHSNNS